MANSSIIESVKNKVIKEFIKDKEIVQAINSPTVPIDSPEDLINTHIFDYNQNPNTINTVATFITVQVHIPYTHGQTAFVKPTLEIWIISHEKHMIVNNIPKVKSNRNDYLSRLIDTKINGKDGYGIGRMNVIVYITMHQHQVTFQLLHDFGVGSNLIDKGCIALLGYLFLYTMMGLTPPAVIDAVVMVPGT